MKMCIVLHNCIPLIAGFIIVLEGTLKDGLSAPKPATSGYTQPTLARQWEREIERPAAMPHMELPQFSCASIIM